MESRVRDVDGSGEGAFVSSDGKMTPTSQVTYDGTASSVDGSEFSGVLSGDGGVGSNSPRRFNSPSRRSEGDKNDENQGNDIDCSWQELRESAEKMLQEELNIAEASFSCETKLQFFKLWFQDNFTNSFLFNHFLRLLSLTLYQHIPSTKLRKDHLPGTLLSQLRRCLAGYWDKIQDLERNLEQTTKKLAGKFEAAIGDSELISQRVREIIQTYQQMLASSTERAVNARVQAESLRTQLNEAVCYIERLERKAFLLDISNEKTQEHASEVHHERRSSREDLERMLLSEKALSNALRTELSEENQLNQRLWSVLKDYSGRVAVLETELAACVEDASRKSQLVNVLAEDAVESFHAELVESLMQTAASTEVSSSDGLICEWQRQLQGLVENKNSELRKLDRQLVDCELLLSDMSRNLVEKQEKVKCLERDWNALKQEETFWLLEVEKQEQAINHLLEKSSRLQHKTVLIEQELQRNQNDLYSLKDSLQRKWREISHLERLHVTAPERGTATFGRSPFGHHSPDSSQAGQPNLASYSLSNHAENVAIKAYASFDSTRLLRRHRFSHRLPGCSPLQANRVTAPDEAFPDRKFLLNESQFKRSMVLKSPNKNDPLKFNISLLSSGSGEHLRCDIAVNDESRGNVAETSPTMRAAADAGRGDGTACARDGVNQSDPGKKLSPDQFDRTFDKRTPLMKRKQLFQNFRQATNQPPGERRWYQRVCGMHLFGNQGANPSGTRRLNNTASHVRNPDQRWR